MTDKSDILQDVQNTILVLNSVACREKNSSMGVDFKQAVFVKLALMQFARVPELINQIESVKTQEPLTAELLVPLKDAYTDFADFIAIYANKSGFDNSEQIAENIQHLYHANVAEIILDPEWN